MDRRRPLAALTPILSSVVAVLAAFVVGGLFLEARGKHAISAYRLLYDRGLGSSLGITETLIKMAPLLIVSAGLLIALKAGVWNIGIDGQLLVGACLVGYVAPKLVGDVPRPILFLICGAVGFAGGMAWGIIPAVLKVRYGLNEIITTIMMNYVGIYLTTWLVKGPFKDPRVVPPQTAVIPVGSRLPQLFGSRVHIGLLVGLAAILVVALLFRYTTLGFKWWVLGQNRRAAVHAGLSVGRLTVLALVLSGGFAGLAGANDVLSTKGLFQGEWNPGYGLTAFGLVYLARLNSLWVIPFAYFFSFLLLGGEMMSRSAQIPTYFVQVLEGLMLAFFAIVVYLERAHAGPSRRRARGEPAVEPRDPIPLPAADPALQPTESK